MEVAKLRIRAAGPMVRWVGVLALSQKYLDVTWKVAVKSSMIAHHLKSTTLSMVTNSSSVRTRAVESDFSTTQSLKGIC